MDLIHAGSTLAEIAFINDLIKFDAQVCQNLSAVLSDNTWQMIIGVDAWDADPIEIDDYVYVPDTEYGGPVEYVKHDTASKQVTVGGATWRGMLMRKYIVPASGASYVTISSTEANAAIDSLVGTKLGSVIDVSTDASGITITSKSFRYTNMLFGIEDMLADEGAALEIAFSQATKKAILSARTIVDYSTTIDLSQDYGINLISQDGRVDGYNHVIALGAGELLDRDIIHVYRNADGTYTTSAPAWADTAADKQIVYDYSNPESTDDLQDKATKKLGAYAVTQSMTIDPSDAGLDMLLGDVVGARDRITGLTATATVIEKILTMDDTGTRIDTIVG